jgi:hypothetical protein
MKRSPARPGPRRATASSILVRLDDKTDALLRKRAAESGKPMNGIINEALASYLQPKLPRGLGQFHSGHEQTSGTDEDLLRDAARERKWR